LTPAVIPATSCVKSAGNAGQLRKNWAWEGNLHGLLALSRAIDSINSHIGKAVGWLIFGAVLVSSANATVRYVFDTSSNAWLELQWYLFATVFLMGAGYTLLNNEHVRIDIVAGRLSTRTRTWIDIIGGLFFLLPMTLVIAWFSWPFFAKSVAGCSMLGLHVSDLFGWALPAQSGNDCEISSDAGGLIRWPAKILIPIGFVLLMLQGVSELIKRIAFLMGLAPDPLAEEGEHHGEHAAN
jgi:TRAP-type mannitol/chloroaromatic compound transport system permease small subunit